MSLDEKLEEFFRLEGEIHKAFGYKEDWVKIPLSDERDQYWCLDEEFGEHGVVILYDKPMTAEMVGNGTIVAWDIYTQRFLPRWVYRAGTHTLVCVNTRCDGNKYISVFDNQKEQDDQALRDAFRRWCATHENLHGG